MANNTLDFMELPDDIIQYAVPGVVSTCVGWTTLYFVISALSPNRSSEWHCRLVAMMHASLVVSLAAWSGFVQGPWPFTDPAGPNTPLQNFVCIISLGYFVYDLVWCLYHQPEDVVVLLHHVISLGANIAVLYRGINGTEMMAVLFGTEITNPLLQIRFFLRYDRASAGNPVNRFFGHVVNWSFFVLFTVMRIILGSMFYYRYMLHPRPDRVAQFFVSSIYLVSWVFWVSIVQYAHRKYFSTWLFGRKENSTDDKPVTNGNGLKKATAINGSPSVVAS